MTPIQRRPNNSGNKKLLMPYKAFFLLIFLVYPQMSAAAVKPIFVFGLGGGCSMITDSDIRSNEYVFETILDFKEKIRLKNRWRFNLQVYFGQDFGFQLDYTHLRASYFSDLKWYGFWILRDDKPEYIPINHFEDAYWSPWSLRSFTVGLIIGGNSPVFGQLYPYATAGIGAYTIKGDPTRFLYRTRLSGMTEGMAIKISCGVRHRIWPFLGINLKVSGETYRTNLPGRDLKAYMGPDQFDIELYYQTGHISRVRNVLTGAITLLSAEISLEFIFKRPTER